jgi:hypothetical protein
MDATLNYDLPYFGPINLNKLEEDYRTTIELDGKDLKIDLNFKNKTVKQDDIVIVKKFLQKIRKFDTQNLKIIKTDFNEASFDQQKINGKNIMEQLEPFLQKVMNGLVKNRSNVFSIFNFLFILFKKI